MKTLSVYLWLYTAIVLMLALYGPRPEAGYEWLHWMSIFGISGLFMVPVVVFNIVIAWVKRK